MSDIGGMVAELIGAGCAPELAARIVAEAFTAGVASAPVRGQSADESAERRREKDRLRKQNVRGNLRKSADSAECPNTPLSSLKIDNRKRGARLPENWSPSADDRKFANDLGWSNSQVDSEAANFRDYWISKPGSGGCKLDWPATWRKWVRSSKVKPAASALTIKASGAVDWDAICANYKKFGMWSKHAPGNEPGMSGCQCPLEIMTKHGISFETGAHIEIPKLRAV